MSESSCLNYENVNPLEIKIICDYFGKDTPENISNEEVCTWITQYAANFRKLIEQ